MQRAIDRLRRVARDMGLAHPDLAAELLVVNRKMNAGLTRDGLLRVISIRPQSVMSLLTYGHSMRTGDIKDDENLQTFAGRTVIVRTRWCSYSARTSTSARPNSRLS